MPKRREVTEHKSAVEEQFGIPLPREVVDNLVDVVGEKLGPKILEFIRNNPVERVLLWGVPGSGKSTALQGIQEILEEEGISTSLIAFDDIRQNFFDWLDARGIRSIEGEPVRRILDIPPAYQQFWKSYLTRRLLEVPAQPSQGRRHIVLVEAPATGNPDREIGQFALRLMAEQIERTRHRRNGQDQYHFHTLAIQIIADRKVYQNAQRIRAAGRDSEQTAGFSAQHGIFQKMASPSQIEEIWGEQLDLAEEQYVLARQAYSSMAQGKAIDSREIAQQALHIPEGINIDSPEEWEEIRILVLYAYHLLYQYTLADFGLVAVNQFAGRFPPFPQPVEPPDSRIDPDYR